MAFSMSEEVVVSKEHIGAEDGDLSTLKRGHAIFVFGNGLDNNDIKVAKVEEGKTSLVANLKFKDSQIKFTKLSVIEKKTNTFLLGIANSGEFSLWDVSEIVDHAPANPNPKSIFSHATCTLSDSGACKGVTVIEKQVGGKDQSWIVSMHTGGTINLLQLVENAGLMGAAMSAVRGEAYSLVLLKTFVSKSNDLNEFEEKPKESWGSFFNRGSRRMYDKKKSYLFGEVIINAFFAVETPTGLLCIIGLKDGSEVRTVEITDAHVTEYDSSVVIPVNTIAIRFETTINVFAEFRQTKTGRHLVIAGCDDGHILVFRLEQGQQSQLTCVRYAVSKKGKDISSLAISKESVVDEKMSGALLFSGYRTEDVEVFRLSADDEIMPLSSFQVSSAHLSAPVICDLGVVDGKGGENFPPYLLVGLNYEFQLQRVDTFKLYYMLQSLESCGDDQERQAIAQQVTNSIRSLPAPCSFIKKDVTGDTPLHIAVRYQLSGVIDALLFKSDDVVGLLTEKNRHGHTVLHMAVEANSLSIVTKFLKKMEKANGNVNIVNIQSSDAAYGSTSAHLAIAKGHLQIAKELFEFDKEYQQSSLFNNENDVAQYCILAADEGWHCLQDILMRFKAAKVDDPSLLHWVNSMTPDDNNLFLQVCYRKDVDMVEKLLDLNLQLGARGFTDDGIIAHRTSEQYATPLHRVLTDVTPKNLKSTKAIIEILFKKGRFYQKINADRAKNLLQAERQQGNGLLHLAVLTKDRGLVESLIGKLKSAFEGNSATFKKFMFDLCKLQNREGQTVLHLIDKAFYSDQASEIAGVIKRAVGEGDYKKLTGIKEGRVEINGNPGAIQVTLFPGSSPSPTQGGKRRAVESKVKNDLLETWELASTIASGQAVLDKASISRISKGFQAGVLVLGGIIPYMNEKAVVLGTMVAEEAILELYKCYNRQYFARLVPSFEVGGKAEQTEFRLELAKAVASEFYTTYQESLSELSIAEAQKVAGYAVQKMMSYLGKRFVTLENYQSIQGQDYRQKQQEMLLKGVKQGVSVEGILLLEDGRRIQVDEFLRYDDIDAIPEQSWLQKAKDGAQGAADVVASVFS